MKKVLLLLLLCTQLAAYSQQIASNTTTTNYLIKSDGSLWAWGGNFSGKTFWDGTTDNKYVPVRLGSANDWKQIAPYGNNVWAIKTDGSLWAWGENYEGFLGDGTTGRKDLPIRIGTDNNWKTISAASTIVALKNDGTLWAWGSNNWGQYGLGYGGYGTPGGIGAQTSYVPKQIGTAADNWKKVIAGGSTIAGIKNDGSLWIWGCHFYPDNSGAYSGQYVPSRNENAYDWKDVAICGEYLLAVKNDGSLWAMGKNAFGQLGDGTTIDRHSAPVRIGIDLDWKSIAVSPSRHSLAIKNDGSLWTWGYNTYFGALGDGTTINRLVPTRIGSSFGWQSATLGGNNAHAINDCGIWSWGSTVNGVFLTPQNIGFNVAATPTITTSGAVKFFQGGSVTLTASSGNSYLWSNGATTQSITVNTAGNYSVTVTNATGCSGTSSATTVQVLAPPGIVQNDTTICAGTTVNLSASVKNLAAFSAKNSDLTLLKSIGNHHYFYKPSAMLWQDAKLKSDSIGAYLYIINDATEEASVYSALPYKGNDSKQYWLGLYQDTTSPSYSETYGGWKWVDGSDVSYSNWYPGEPNNSSTGENFAQIDWIGYGSQWNDAGLPATNGTELSYPIFEFESDNYSVLWSTGATTPTISVSPSQTTKYFVTITDGLTTYRDSVTVTVNTAVATITPASSATICQGGNVTLTANAGQSYLWSNSAVTRSITTNTPGTYTVSVTNATGCTATSLPTVVGTSALPTATITASGTTTFCQGASVLLTASTGSAYLWSNGETTQSIIVSSAGSYTVQVFNASGCSATSAATVVVVNLLPIASITASGATTFCQGASVLLTASTGSAYLWSNGETTQSIRVSSAGSYTVQVFNASGCSATSAATIVVVNLLPTASITASGATTFCQGGSVTLTASAGSTYLWSTGAITRSITVNSSGNYTVQITNASGCLSIAASMLVTVNLPTSAVRYPTIIALKNVSKPLSARLIGAYTYLWIPSTGLDNEFIARPNFNYDRSQEYIVQQTSAGGCITRDTVLVKVPDKSQIFVPKAFSPNGDGNNELLKPILVGLDKLIYFRVYNRWGILVYETSVIGEGWNGFYKGEKQLYGAYSWIAQGEDSATGKVVNATGSSVLIR
jgi:gliding motility-associated-like protein